MYKSANNQNRAKGSKPSTVARQAARRANGAALDRLTEPPQAPSDATDAPRAPRDRAERRRDAPAADARRARPARPAPAEGVGCGGIGQRARGRAMEQSSGVSRGHAAISRQRRVRAGDVVWNASGRGVWGKGTVVAVVPTDVCPWYWCKRHKVPLVFRRDCGPSMEERYVVRGDDGELHTPRRVVLAGGAV